ncbi:MAG: ABC transporter permease [Clostridiales bacterium]|jgi:peptide/nickel transport system permease protein/oligopeptide transport system permease protein|nr:ABC transporter permease [Clostridiales bacterium]MDR2750089.1 ABC transporter permease [Clostridiales bacterium]
MSDSIKKSSPAADAWHVLKQSKSAMLGLIIIVFLFLLALGGKLILPHDPYIGSMAENFQPPSAAHWMGTDELGRDILSRIIDGTRISLRVGIVSVLAALVVGTALGATAAYYGKRVDMIIMRFMDMMLAIPDILLAIAIMAALGPGIDKAIIAISFVTIPQYARIVRGCVLSVKESDYIAAARLVGNKDWRIIARHILPNVASAIIVRSTLGISSAILDAAALGFLGLGVQPPYAEWGTMLGSGRLYIFNAPYIVVFPGLAITITVLAFNLFGDGLRDALDPKGKIR